MVLNWVEFKNKDINLSINRVHFNSNISLLVGLTGSGKSQILKSCVELQLIQPVVFRVFPVLFLFQLMAMIIYGVLKPFVLKRMIVTATMFQTK